MASKTIGARVPKEVIRHLSEFMEVEGVDKSTAIRRVLEKGMSEWRKERALKLLGEGKVTFLKAVEADISVYELMELVRQVRPSGFAFAPTR